MSHLVDSGSPNLSKTPNKAKNPPMPYISRQPFVANQPAPPTANERPYGNAAAGVVNMRPSQTASTVPIPARTNRNDVYLALPFFGATSLRYELTIARSAPTPIPVMNLARAN